MRTYKEYKQLYPYDKKFKQKFIIIDINNNFKTVLQKYKYGISDTFYITKYKCEMIYGKEIAENLLKNYGYKLIIDFISGKYVFKFCDKYN